MEKENIVLRHYNKFKPINCKVLSGDVNKLFTVQFTDNENKEAEIVKGDPVLIGILENEDTILVNGGSVVSATPKEDRYIICSNNVGQISKEIDKREFDRYPVSILGDIKLIETNKRVSACIKNISYSGIGIYSSAEFELSDTVGITIYLSNNVTGFDGTIVRKSKSYGRNEYGIQIIHRDKNAMHATQSQISTLIQNERELMHRHLINSNFKIL